MLQQLTARQLLEWFEYYKATGFGDRWADTLNSQLCAVVANFHRNPKTDPFKRADFAFWEVEEPPERQLTPEEKDRMIGRIFGL
jgi:hypothetical protein